VIILRLESCADMNDLQSVLNGFSLDVPSV
jgi:hypothetical protein